MVLDLGAKQHMLRRLVDRGCSLVVVPPSTSFSPSGALGPLALPVTKQSSPPGVCCSSVCTIVLVRALLRHALRGQRQAAGELEQRMRVG